MDSGAGKAVVDIKADTQEVKLSTAVLRQLGNYTLEVKSGKLSLQIPSSLFKQLLNKLPAGQQEESTIYLKMVPLGSKAKEVVAAVESSSRATVALKGEIYEFSLSATTKSGTTETLSVFDHPITLSLAAAESFDPSQGGMYYINENDELKFLKSDYANGVLTTTVSHFSKYAVLELDRTFTDVPASHWANSVIKELAAKGYVEGTNEDQFEPGRAVTRAEFTTMLVHSLGLTVAGEIQFSDVATDAWYAEPISIATQAGIVKGRSAVSFQPDSQITREEITVMLMKAYELNVGNVPVGSTDILFTDMDQVSSWAADSVKDAARLGLVQGQRRGQFVPKEIASRAEAAQVIYNLILK